MVLHHPDARFGDEGIQFLLADTALAASPPGKQLTQHHISINQGIDFTLRCFGADAQYDAALPERIYEGKPQYTGIWRENETLPDGPNRRLTRTDRAAILIDTMHILDAAAGALETPTGR